MFVQDYADDKKIDEIVSPKTFFETSLKTSFHFDPLTMENVKETIRSTIL